jgi:hypothetical protein
MPFWACRTSVAESNLKENDTMTAEEELIQNGWQRRAICDDPRLTEIVAQYERIGFEVHLEPIRTENQDGCTDCMQHNPDRFKIIYTRKKSG